jgi:predicted nucleic acid-binding protein
MAVLTDKLRVMVDANVLVAGMGWPRWPYALLQHAVAGDFQLVLSPFVIEEAQRHLGRIAPHALPRFQTFLALSEYEAIEDPTSEMIATHQNLVRDAKDIPVALAAMQAEVDCLISSDKDLTESEGLKERVRVLLPAVFLRDFMGWTSEELEAIRWRNWSDMA